MKKTTKALFILLLVLTAVCLASCSLLGGNKSGGGKSGKKVAMTGDGVNDILAFKESDCSIAMASGAEATRSASNIIMLDNNFASMPSIVSEGRRVINNISKASSLFLTKTFFTIRLKNL